MCPIKLTLFPSMITQSEWNKLVKFISLLPSTKGWKHFPSWSRQYGNKKLKNQKCAVPLLLVKQIVAARMPRLMGRRCCVDNLTLLTDKAAALVAKQALSFPMFCNFWTRYKEIISNILSESLQSQNKKKQNKAP